MPPAEPVKLTDHHGGRGATQAGRASPSLRRIFFNAAMLGLMSTLVPSLVRYRRMLKDRKSNPSSRWTIRVLSWLKDSPFGFSQVLSLSRTCSTTWRLSHNATKSSA